MISNWNKLEYTNQSLFKKLICHFFFFRPPFVNSQSINSFNILHILYILYIQNIYLKLRVSNLVDISFWIFSKIRHNDPRIVSKTHSRVSTELVTLWLEFKSEGAGGPRALYIPAALWSDHRYHRSCTTSNKVVPPIHEVVLPVTKLQFQEFP